MKIRRENDDADGVYGCIWRIYMKKKSRIRILKSNQMIWEFLLFALANKERYDDEAKIFIFIYIICVLMEQYIYIHILLNSCEYVYINGISRDKRKKGVTRALSFILHIFFPSFILSILILICIYFYNNTKKKT